MLPRILLGLLALVAIGVFAYQQLEATSPGGLSRVHAAHPDLQGSAGCATCHGDEGFVTSCATCHADVADDVRTGLGFHGTLGADAVPAESCATCHREHQGTALRLVTETSWRLAGVDEVEAFDHARLGYTPEGVHTELDCTACHANAHAPHLEAGQARFAGLDQDCTTCHTDPHEGAIERGCAECHGQSEAFPAVATFEHTAAFALEGAHALEALRAALRERQPATQARATPHPVTTGDTCLACHAPGSAHSVEALADHPPTTERSCVDCHADPHERAYGTDCAACHAPQTGWRDLVGFSHDAFALRGVHAAASCTDCHAPGSPNSVDAVSVRAPGAGDARSCNDCHTSPHSPGFLAASAERDNDCASCHGTAAAAAGFRVAASLPADFHAATAMPLVAPHADADCAACHGGTATRARFVAATRTWTVAATETGSFRERFRPATPRDPADCAACHVDPHAGESFASTEARASDADCTACHADTAFTPHHFGVAEHADTRFPLDASHAAVACVSCHTETLPTGLTRFGGTPQECAACHTNPHPAAQLGDLSRLRLLASDPGEPSAPRLQRAADPRPSCAQCHTPETFDVLTRAAAEAFDHEAWCGFALDGAHGALDCTACHQPTPTRPLGSVPVRADLPGPASVARCDNCHADVHAGAFDGPGKPAVVAGRTDCARCHTTAAFDLDAGGHFDHGLWTGYALEGQHADVACADCHSGPAKAAALGRVPGNDCASCHADVHLGQFAGPKVPNGGPGGAPNQAPGGATDCRRCHAPDAGPGFALVGFDHAERFELDATHAALDCAACHKPYPLSTGGSVVRYRPLGTQCADCHGAAPK